MIVDYYAHRKEQLREADLYNMEQGVYHYDNGWNSAAVKAFGAAAIFSVATVWVPWFAVLSGFNWVIGAILGGVIYHVMAKDNVKV